MLSKGEVVQVSQDSANNDSFPSKVEDLGREGRLRLVKHSDSGNWNADTLIFFPLQD